MEIFCLPSCHPCAAAHSSVSSMFAQEAVSAPKGFDVGLMCAGCMLRLKLCEVQIGFDVGLMANLLNTAWARLTHMVRNHLFMIMSGDKIERLRLPDS